MFGLTLYKVEGTATLQWIVIENIEQRDTLSFMNLPKLLQTWRAKNWNLVSGHVFFIKPLNKDPSLNKAESPRDFDGGS